MLTGNGDSEVDVSAMEAGAADYLIKGRFGGPHLERSIRCALGIAVERHQAIDALKRAEERYALAWRGTNDGLWDWDLATNRIYYSPRWKSILGYEDEQIADSTLEWFNRVHPLDLERVRAELAEHLAGKASLLETEYRILHRDGTYRWVFTRGLAARDERGTAVRMAGSQSDITARKLAERRLREEALYDALTGLPSRALVLDRLDRALARTRRRPDGRLGVLALKIDDFKPAIDSPVRPVRDRLLIAVSRRLGCCLREADTLARTGGADFIALIDSVETVEDILSLPDRIVESLRAPFALDDHQAVVSVMIGVALSGNSDMNADELVRNAEIAMYRGKTPGKSHVTVFE
jgi:diguanylate cyclase (GGDEF)-like protein/PAS domain S-box-containing protein